MFQNHGQWPMINQSCELWLSLINNFEGATSIYSIWVQIFALDDTGGSWLRFHILMLSWINSSIPDPRQEPLCYSTAQLKYKVHKCSWRKSRVSMPLQRMFAIMQNIDKTSVSCRLKTLVWKKVSRVWMPFDSWYISSTFEIYIWDKRTQTFVLHFLITEW